MKRKTIYIAGQIRNDKNYRARFEAAHEWLEAMGWQVVNPIYLTETFGTPADVQSNPRLLRAVMDAELAAIPHLCEIKLRQYREAVRPILDNCRKIIQAAEGDEAEGEA